MIINVIGARIIRTTVSFGRVHNASLGQVQKEEQQLLCAGAECSPLTTGQALVLHTSSVIRTQPATAS